MPQCIRVHFIATIFVVMLAVGMVPVVGQALEIVFDDQHDLNSFVSGNQDAEAALAAAAADVSAAITSQLNAIPSDTFVGTNGSTQITFNWSFEYTNPADGTAEVVNLARANADEVTIFVGGRSISGNTLGAGGPGFVGFAGNPPSGVGSGSSSELAAAVATAESQSEAAYLRGGAGPIIGTQAGEVKLGPPGNLAVSNFSVDFGAVIGSLWFDTDPTNAWHFDHTTNVPAGKNDFYTVALHEILHTLGMGSSASWTSMVSGTNWSGSEVGALVGGSGVIDGDGSHLASGLQSTRVSDGVSQSALMTGSISPGTRKKLTALDLAFLRDIGWETIDPVAPGSDGDYNGNGVVDAADYAVWLDSVGDSVAAGSGADGSSNGIVDQADYQFWKSRFGDVIGTATVTLIPEPAGMSLAVLGLMSIAMWSLPRRKTTSGQA